MKCPDSLEVVEGEGVGRHVKTLRDLTQGDTVVEEAPVVSCACAPLPRAPKTTPSCWHCQRALVTQGEINLPKFLVNDKYKAHWPCDVKKFEKCGACSVDYCSEACRKAAAALYHDAECASVGRVRELQAWLRDNPADGWNYSAAVLLAIRLHFIRKQIGDDAADDLLRPYQRVEPLRLAQRLAHYKGAIDACLAGVDSSCDDPHFRDALLVALTNSMTFVCSPKHLFFDRVQKETSTTINDSAIDPISLLTPSERSEVEGLTEGVGLYPLVSMMNHSCMPSCGANAVATEDHTLRIVGLRTTPAGAAVTLSYLAVNPDVPDNDKLLCKERYSILYRRGQLMPHWRFDCRCTMCVDQMAVIRGMADWVKTHLLETADAERAAAAKYEMNTPTDDEYDRLVDELDTENGSDATVVQLRALAETHNHQPSYHTLACLYYYESHPHLVKKDNAVAMRFFALASVLNGGYTLNGRLSWMALSELLFDEIELNSGNGAYLEGAVLLLRAAADQGIARAQASLAFYLSENYMQEAWQWVETAISQGQPQATHLAATWAKEGKGLERPNVQMALALFERAKKEGYPLSDEELAFLESGGQ